MSPVQRELVDILEARPNTTLVVARLYLIAYGRAPDLTGLTDFSDRLSRRESLLEIAEAVIASDEFQRLYHNTDPRRAIYRNATGRDLSRDDTDIVGLVTSLALCGAIPIRDDGAPGLLVTRQQPDASAIITRLYRVVYGRNTDPDGHDHFRAVLQAGEPLSSVVRSLVQSDEFRARNGDPVSALQIYRNAGAVADDPRNPLAEFLAGLVLWIGEHDCVNIAASLFPAGLALDDAAAYKLWMRQTEARPPAAPAVPSDSAGISWIMLLWHPNLALLQRAVASVIAQAGRWRLIISWSGILAHDIYHYLSYLGRTDARVILLRTGSRSAAVLFGSALFYAQETHTCLIGQHDRLSTGANRSLCLAVETADIVIADEDELKDDGERSAPHMGTVWDPEASACIDRRGLIVFSTSLLREVGGMRDSRTGFGEWDMLLRAAAKINEHRIKHVPRIMCYRSCRVYGAGTPASRVAALGAYLAASPAYVGAVAHWLNGAPRIQHALPAEPPMVSIIIPTRDRPEYLETCVRSMLSLTSYKKFEILILDNDSQENRTSELLHEFEMTHHIRVIKCSGAFNWSLLNNSGVAHMHGEIAVFLNNDTEVHDPGWLTEIVVQANRREVGAVGIRLLYPNGNIQHAGIVLGPHGRSTHVWRHTQGDDPGYLEQLRSVRRVSAVTGACLATRRSVFDSVGGFECQHLRVTWSDVDYCLRVREQGLHVLWTPHATLIHHEQATRGPDNTAQAAQRLSVEQDYMRSRWGDVLDTDPFWSPNMWPGDKDPLLSFLPPRATQ